MCLKFRILALGLIFLLLISGCSGGSISGKVAFSGTKNGARELYVMNIDGSGLKQLTHLADTAGTDLYTDQAFWSPDGTMVAFVTVINERPMVFNLVLATVDGEITEVRTPQTDQIWPKPMPIGWSPDGKYLAFALSSEYYSELQPIGLYLTDRQGNVSTLDTTHSTLWASWLPTSNQLVAIEAIVTGGEPSLNLIGLDRKITLIQAFGGSGAYPEVRVLGHALSPDSQRLIYSMAKDSQLCSINIDGTDNRCLQIFGTFVGWLDNERFLYTRQRGQGEFYNIVRFDGTAQSESTIPYGNGFEYFYLSNKYLKYVKPGERNTFTYYITNTDKSNQTEIRFPNDLLISGFTVLLP